MASRPSIAAADVARGALLELATASAARGGLGTRRGTFSTSGVVEAPTTTLDAALRLDADDEEGEVEIADLD